LSRSAVTPVFPDPQHVPSLDRNRKRHFFFELFHPNLHLATDTPPKSLQTQVHNVSFSDRNGKRLFFSNHFTKNSQWLQIHYLVVSSKNLPSPVLVKEFPEESVVFVSFRARSRAEMINPKIYFDTAISDTTQTTLCYKTKNTMLRNKKHILF